MRVSLGIARKIDELGRVVIPREILNKLGMDLGCEISSRVEGSEIVIIKHVEGKTRGIVRKLDSLGRSVIAKEVRRKLDIVENETSVEFFLEDEKIIIKKYAPGCTFCNSLDVTKVVHGKNVCKRCVEVIRV